MEIIGEWAFEQCRGLVEVKLHDGLKEIRRQAFNNCISLTLIDIPGSVTDLGKNTEVSTSQYEGWVFENCTNLSTITLHEGLKKLYVSTFSRCGVVSINIPTTVTDIPDYAFQECTKMSQVYCLGSTPPTLGTAAFDSSLKSISTLFVPEAAISAYSSSSWNPYFKEIKKDLLHP